MNFLQSSKWIVVDNEVMGIVEKRESEEDINVSGF
jgi:hypothetical protein